LRRVELAILHELAVSNRSFWELLDRSECTLNEFVTALRNLQKDGFIAADKGIFYITEKGKRRINLESLEFKADICPKCLGKRIIPKAKFTEILDEFKRITEKRPPPTFDFFQGYMLEQDVIARVALMHHYGDLDGKNFILIGDDDLLSIALALTQLPSRIVVLDVDKRLGNFLKAVNRDYGLDIEFIEYNVADPLPVDLRGIFDVFSSEPLESLSGLKAFIIRGVSALKENGVGYFGLTRYEASLKKWLAIQKLLARMNCVVTDLIPGFSVYPMNYGDVNYEEFAAKLGFPADKNPGINWYKSALFRFEVFGKASLPTYTWRKMHVETIDPDEDLTHPALASNLSSKS